MAWCYECDVSQREAVREMAARVRAEVGDVNILVNNAGIMITKQFLQQTDEEIQSTINVSSATNRLIGEVVQSRRRPLLGPSPG